LIDVKNFKKVNHNRSKRGENTESDAKTIVSPRCHFVERALRVPINTTLTKIVCDKQNNLCGLVSLAQKLVGVHVAFSQATVTIGLTRARRGGLVLAFSDAQSTGIQGTPSEKTMIPSHWLVQRTNLTYSGQIGADLRTMPLCSSYPNKHHCFQ
jgi:hypothetical protein